MSDLILDKRLVAVAFPGLPVLASIFKECTPKILVVSDGLSFDAADFGLKDFVDSLKATTIHGMTPIVETAHMNATAADYTNFTFTDASFSIKKYDVLFLFGVSTAPALAPAQVDVIARFMQAGGGVFATGDHEELGKALCNGLPRVRKMRYWSNPDVPSAGGTDRISTNLPGSDNVYQFDDQSDALPQRLYPRYYADGAPSNSKPHYILQHPTKKVIEVFPDHPHEGECVVPTSLAGNVSVGGASVPEWPNNSLGVQVAPELIAMSMSAGGGFDFKQPLIPRSFGAIGAYDGHGASVGRVTVDATWHHFININLVASSSGPGLAGDPDTLERVHTYFRNTAEWLMPKKTRRCLRWPVLRAALELYPAREIIPFPAGDPLKDVRIAADLGAEMEKTLARFMTPAALRELTEDVLDLFNESLAAQLKPNATLPLAQALARRLIPTDMLFRVALGVTATTLARALPLGENLENSYAAAGGKEGLEKATRANLEHSFRDMGSMLRESVAHVDILCAVLSKS